jgi:hypothetical protein
MQLKSLTVFLLSLIFIGLTMGKADVEKSDVEKPALVPKQE